MDFKNLVVTSWQNTLNHIGPVLLVTFVQVLLTFVSFGLLAPVTMAGYMQSLLQVVRDGRAPEIKDLFSEMQLFFPLLVFFLVFAGAAALGFVLFFLPGFIVVAFVVFATLYLIPLMTDRGLGLFEALKESWEMAMEQPVSDHIVVTIIYVAIMSLGSSLPFVFLITQPLATFVLLGAYQEKSGSHGTNHRDTPDQSESEAASPSPVSESDDNKEI